MTRQLGDMALERGDEHGSRGGTVYMDVSPSDDEPHPPARIVGHKIQVLPLRTIHHDRTTGTWQTLAALVGERLTFDLPHADPNGYITLSRRQAEQLRDMLEFDGHLLPPLLEADRETVAALQRVLAQPTVEKRQVQGRPS